MNILIEQLPTAVEIEGQEYEIDTDFRSCLRIILAFEDPQLTTAEKQLVLLDNLYPELPPNMAAAFELGIKFLNGGETAASDDEPASPLKLYSFSQDANYIYAAFRQTHGVDLSAVSLHWWLFLALFMDLGADTTFCNLIALRKRLQTGKATKEDRQMANEMAGIVELEDPISDAEQAEQEAKEAEFIRLWQEGQRKREQANG